MLFTTSLKRRNCCHYQTLKNVSSHRWIKADGTNSERVPNHPTTTQNPSMYSLPHNISGMYLCLCFNPCLDLLNLVTHVYLLLNEERHPQICFPWNSTSVFSLWEKFLRRESLSCIRKRHHSQFWAEVSIVTVDYRANCGGQLDYQET